MMNFHSVYIIMPLSSLIWSHSRQTIVLIHTILVYLDFYRAYTREDENRYILAAAVMRRDWAEVSVLHFTKADFQHPISQKQTQIQTCDFWSVDFWALTLMVGVPHKVIF